MCIRDSPYEVEFRHNAFGDVYGEPADGLVAFNLDSLPDTEAVSYTHLDVYKRQGICPHLFPTLQRYSFRHLMLLAELQGYETSVYYS